MSKFVRGQYLNTELRKENDRLRAALQKAESERDVISGLISERDAARLQAKKAEAEFSARLETIKKDRREWVDRCAKAEAESVRLNRELGAACELAERSREIILSALNKAPEYWYDNHDNGLWSAEHIAFAIAALFAERDALRADLVDRDACIEALKTDRAGLERCEEVAIRLKQERDSERARAERYLAAMQDAVRAYDRLAKGGYGGDLAVAWATLRSIVEEARRG